MSKGKEFPPRLYGGGNPAQTLRSGQVVPGFYSATSQTIQADWTAEPIAWISMAEHSHLLAEARRQAYTKAAEDFRQAGETSLYNYYYMLAATASEGASDE